ncbi:cupin-like domain-containing protein [Sphingomonas sp. HITSZ_GF]|uniref:cupin-like domain-containing protein n=1 Tax=Sphingomonas sp. HITSZ_GF TaxID=3037247 RepID=UPI00240DEA28|nr:cupin-like domain-containing protein [Sphingomonas sp. HITSZ_GF]MDG2535160.1 cupin-like domain-containing protein [Sphingomonas sp. HITSZ_GF]
MNAVVQDAPRVRELHGIAPDAIPYAELLAAQAPVILRGVARDWPLIVAARESDEAAIAYLERFDAGQPVVGFTGPPEIEGRFHYNADLTGFNFKGGRAGLTDLLERIRASLDVPAADSVYIGSTDLDRYLPGFRAENDLPLADPMFAHGVLASIWIGTRTTAQAHHDMSHNMAVCAAGRRRFTLFPPDQVANLYPGPLEPTPGGQVISMVDFAAPDPVQHPRFRDALAAAQVAELEPGDLLFYPALWWHHVEALERFNILVNYWWNEAPAFLDTPQTTLLHAMLSLRDRPDAEKAAWKAMFDYYVFGPAGQAAAHLPDHAQGPLAPIDALSARRLRAQIINKLNR